MSIAIDISKVNRVLLADGWHDVAKATFELDAYEYVAYPSEDSLPGDAELRHGGGQSGVCATGFTFKTTSTPDRWCSGPLTAILAVQHSN